MNIISCHTKDVGYTKEAQGLKETLDKFSIDTSNVQPFDSLGSWEKNCQYKAEFIKGKLLYLNEPVIWLDSDARLLKYPGLFEDITTDVGFYYLKSRDGYSLLSGTMYFKPCPSVYSLLDSWIELNKTNDKWDQRNLSEVVEDSTVSITRLPVEYCQIFDNKKGVTKKTVVVHGQASRRLKKLMQGG